jgi:hypothetical protein
MVGIPISGLKVLDFGLVRTMGSTDDATLRAADAAIFVATPNYMSTEAV